MKQLGLAGEHSPVTSAWIKKSLVDTSTCYPFIRPQFAIVFTDQWTHEGGDDMKYSEAVW
jgi:hypothetical protein